MAGVRLDGVRKVYDNGFVAVHDATFDVADGEFVVLVGPSGCGKSTTLRMIAGLEAITAGELRIGDRVVNDVPASRRDIAMVFQNYALYPHMSVYENMAFALKLRNAPQAEIERRVREAAAILEIEGILDRRRASCPAASASAWRSVAPSCGSRRSSSSTSRCRTSMRSCGSRRARRSPAAPPARRHHDLRDPRPGRGHDHGRPHRRPERGPYPADGPPLELYERPSNRFVAGFIGSPAMNFMDGIAREEGGTLHAEVLGGHFDLPMPARSASPWRRCGPAASRWASVPRTYTCRGSRVPRHGVGVDAVVDAVEPMGNEVFIYARAAGQRPGRPHRASAAARTR
jgi:multiple sugar transport system ATP-binding protein